MLRWLGRAIVTITGWRIEGELPSSRRYVLIAAPHTSNWDFLHLLSLAWSRGLRVAWMGKHTLFRGPMGPLMRALGGVPVNRLRRNDLVAEMSALFARREHLVLTVPPEGTRSRAAHWRSGFYRIAFAAEVPIHLGYLDYPSRTGGLGAWIEATGDVGADMDRIRAFYADKRGRWPDRVGPVWLREEKDEPG